MKTNKRSLIVRTFSCVLLLFACFYMYDFYKCLSGFIANGFREPFVMLPMVLAFFLPVFCFLFFFYDVFVRAINPIVKVAYSIFVILYAASELVLIFSNISLYASNNTLGVYDSLPSIVLHFPYDMIVILSLLLIWQVISLISSFAKNCKIRAFICGIKQHGTVKVSVIEYILLCVFAIVVFVFTGAGIYATFSAFENAFYDARYIYLLLWVALIPMMNLVLVTLKPEKKNFKKSKKLLLLGGGIALNIIFGVLFLVFELTYPDFLVHIGKPLFLIAFSVSLPIEPAIILAFMALGTLTMAIRFITTAKKAK